MRSFFGRILAVLWSGILGFAIIVFGAGAWAALVTSNLTTSPAIPWAVPTMALILWAMWQYLGGKWWPRSTSETRHRYMRAGPVSRDVFVWALLAGMPSILALAGFWIVMFHLVKMPGNALPDFSKYPPLTVALMIAMGSLAAPLTEEPAFRGYCDSGARVSWPDRSRDLIGTVCAGTRSDAGFPVAQTSFLLSCGHSVRLYDCSGPRARYLQLGSFSLN